MSNLPPPPPPPGEPQPFVGPEQIAAFTLAADQLRLVVEMVGGYKRQMMDAGFSEEAAESMAVIFHGEIVHKIFAG
jgi:hypothetical protein